jgi:hypothetical protein
MHGESIGYAKCGELLQIAISADATRAELKYHRNSSLLVGFGGGDEFGDAQRLEREIAVEGRSMAAGFRALA